MSNTNNSSILATLNLSAPVKSKGVVTWVQSTGTAAQVFVDENGTPTGHVFFDLTDDRVGSWEPVSEENPAGRLVIKIATASKIAKDLAEKVAIYPDAEANLIAGEKAEVDSEIVRAEKELLAKMKALEALKAKSDDLLAQCLGVNG